MSVVWEAVAILLIAAVGTWLMQRQLEREEQERRRREWLAASPQAQAISKAFVELQIVVRDNFTPAMRRVAESMARFAREINTKGDA